MNSSLSGKGLFRGLSLTIALMLVVVVVGRAQDSAAPTPSPAAVATEEKAPMPEPTAPPAQVAPASDAPPPVPASAEEKSQLRRLDTLSANEPTPTTTPTRTERRRVTSRIHTGADRVAFGHDSFLGQGERADSVVSIFGSSTSEGEVSDAVISIAGDTRVTGPVGDAAVAVLGNVYINNKVNGDVVAVLGSVDLGPDAEVGGHVVAVGGTVTRDPHAITHRGIQNVGLSVGRVTGFEGLRAWFRECFLYARPLAVGPHLEWAWGIAFSFLALYAIIALVFRGAVEKCVQTLEQRPGSCILAVVLTLLITPIVTVLLAITGVGLIVVPFIGMGLFVASLFGRAVLLAWLGRRLTKTLALPIAVLIGGALVLALYVIPVLGFIVYALMKSVGLGVVIYTVILAVRSERPVPIVAAAQAGPVGTVPVAPLVPVVPTVPPSTPPSSGFTSGVVPSPESVQPLPPVMPKSATEPGIVSSPSPMAESPLMEPSISYTPPPPPPAFRLAPMAPPVPVATLPRAGFWIRTGALLLDLILMAILLEAILHTGPFLLVGLAVYGALMWKFKGTTVGGIICGIKVVRLDDRPMDWPTAIVRALSCFLSMAVAGLGFIWVVFDDQRQSWHDKIAGTVVVKMPKGASLV